MWRFSTMLPLISRPCGEALLQAQDLVYIVGWDIHSETRLVGEFRASG